MARASWPLTFSAGASVGRPQPRALLFFFLIEEACLEGRTHQSYPLTFLGRSALGLQYFHWKVVRNYDSISFFLFFRQEFWNGTLVLRVADSWSSYCGSVLLNPISIHEDVALNPGLAQGVKDPTLL